jgi:MFS transporter, PPP family, 3-phenylpropionic acid transporter
MPIESTIPIASTSTARRFAARLALFYDALFGVTGALSGAAVMWLARHRLADQPQSAASGG